MAKFTVCIDQEGRPVTIVPTGATDDDVAQIQNADWDVDTILVFADRHEVEVLRA